MSFREEKYLTYKRSGDVAELSYIDNEPDVDLQHLFREVLNDKVHGLCFSLYEEGQGPGDQISEAQIRKRIEVLAPHTEWIRSFSCTEGNQIIPVVAKEYGLKTLVGAWLSSDKEKNEEEIKNLIKLARDGYVDIAAVGNEVLYRDDLSETELLDYMKDVKEELTDIPVGYVDAYYEFTQRPALVENSDVILCNCYPYWEGTSFEHSFQHMRQMYHQAKNVAQGKEIIITETGWPSKGEPLGDAIPSEENALKYFINTNLWAQDEDVAVFYFSSFDESWKKSNEGEVGAYWGIWDHNGKLKY
ncbi:glycosyl hydrolase family 17 protein [Gracilimonas sp. Q87]|uniref:glycoside hydrolase family 17 protein n=1 Tax=Gracilimonas sp. Q87 TaxID=3384766 RepID=UPI003983F82C